MKLYCRTKSRRNGTEIHFKINSLRILGVYPFIPDLRRSAGTQEGQNRLPCFSLTFLTFFVAKDAGIFKKHGLDVELIQLAGAVQTSALVAGEIDHLTGITGPLVAAARPAF